VVQKKVAGEWQDVGLNAPFGRINYEEAHIDKKGNTFVKLGGSASGFNYIGNNGLVIVFAKMQWNQKIPHLVKIVANPFGAGIIGFDLEGRLFKIEPPNAKNKKFQVIPISDAQSISRLTYCYKRLFVVTTDGEFGFLNGDSNFANNFETITLPDSLAANDNFTMLSTNELNVAARLKRIAGSHQSENRTASGTTDPRNEISQFPYFNQKGDIELPGRLEEVDGRRIRIAENGTEIKPPPSVFEGFAQNELALPFLAGTDKVLTDSLIEEIFYEKFHKIYGRIAESDSVMSTLVREKGKIRF